MHLYILSIVFTTASMIRDSGRADFGPEAIVQKTRKSLITDVASCIIHDSCTELQLTSSTLIDGIEVLRA